MTWCIMALVDVLWSLFLVGSALADDRLIVPPVTEGKLGSSVTLQCRLETEGRWYVISWARLHDNGSDTLLVTLPSGQMVPEWNPSISRSMRMRIQPLISVQPALVEFHLVLSQLTCAERGLYRCRGVATFGDPTATTRLTLRHSPGPPLVTYVHETWTANATYTIFCQADAGLPPQEFLWYWKSPRSHNFQIAEGQGEAEYYETEGCRTTLRRAVRIVVTSELDGTSYRCALPGRVNDEGLFAELLVQLPPPVEVVVVTSLEKATDCRSANCPVQRIEMAEASNSAGSSQSHSAVVTCLLAGLLTPKSYHSVITTTLVRCVIITWLLAATFTPKS